MSWGATPEEWAAAIRTWGSENLLPVVSNPNATISPTSNMQALGKTPSRYNARGEAVGIAGWTDKIATATEVEAWSKRPDYGICVQTRGRFRAFDIDVEDERLARQHACDLSDLLGVDHYVYRFRENSGRILVPIVLQTAIDESRFKSLKVEGGTVDLLGPGRQFVAYGTHPSGARYKWRIAIRKASEKYARWASKFDGSDLA